MPRQTLRTVADGAAEIVRLRLLQALAADADVRVRFLCAPVGSGKTTVLRQYVRATPGAYYVAAPRGASKDELMRALRAAEGSSEIVLDDADLASPAALEALFAQIEGASDKTPRYVLAGAARSRLPLRRLVFAGIARHFDGAFLAFDRREIAELAEGLGVQADNADVEQLHYDTDGWAVAVAWVIRDAARDGRSLRGAFELWRQHNDYLFLEFVGESVDETASRTFRAILTERYEGDTQEALFSLEAAGYPVMRTRADLRPYRVLMQLASPVLPAETSTDGGILAISLFGRFGCTIQGHRIAFPRRREQNVLAYLALSRDASVSRSELMRTFWPDAPQAVASQGLRTSLSRLRKTIAVAAGEDDADRYVVIGPTLISLDLDCVSIDARRFADHVERGRLADVHGDVRGALEHYQIAEHLYSNPLLAAEAIEPALAPRAAEYAAMFESILRRLVAMNLAAGDTASAHRYARRSDAGDDDRISNPDERPLVLAGEAS